MNEVELRVGDFISGGFNFSSSEFQLGNSYADLISPAFSGKVQLEEDILTGILELDINQSLRLGVGLQHFFLRDTGDAMLQIAAYDFSDAAPLTSLFALQDFDADIVAGAVEGLANISWSKQVDESWRFWRPYSLKTRWAKWLLSGLFLRRLEHRPVCRGNDASGNEDYKIRQEPR